MRELRLLVIKSMVFILVLASLNFLYKYTFFETDLQTHSTVINQIRKVINDSSEIVYLGESSNLVFHKNDADKRVISQFISDYFPSKKVGTISNAAYHAGIYYQLLQHIPANSAVKTVIVTMNLRSFNYSWIYSGLETPLQKSILLLKPYPPLFNRLLLAFQYYDIKTFKEWEQLYIEKWKTEKLKLPYPFKYNSTAEWDLGMATQGILNADSTVNHELSGLACAYVKAYGFQINTLTNERIADFDRIVNLAKQRNWKLVFNLLSENTDKVNSLVGKDMLLVMKQNRDLLVKRYAKNNVHVVDNLNIVCDEDFIDITYPTEHYKERGRKQIAKNVADYLKGYFKK